MNIFKYTLDITDEQLVDLPIDARLLDIQLQRGKTFLWAEIDPSAKTEKRVIYCRGTGHLMREAEGCPFIATVQYENGWLVFHFFDGGVR